MSEWPGFLYSSIFRIDAQFELLISQWHCPGNISVQLSKYSVTDFVGEETDCSWHKTGKVRLGGKAAKNSEIFWGKKSPSPSPSLCAELERVPKLCLVLILSRLFYAQRALQLQCSPNLVHTCQRNYPHLALPVMPRRACTTVALQLQCSPCADLTLRLRACNSILSVGFWISHLCLFSSWNLEQHLYDNNASHKGI